MISDVRFWLHEDDSRHYRRSWRWSQTFTIWKLQPFWTVISEVSARDYRSSRNGFQTFPNQMPDVYDRDSRRSRRWFQTFSKMIPNRIPEIPDGVPNWRWIQKEKCINLNAIQISKQSHYFYSTSRIRDRNKHILIKIGIFVSLPCWIYRKRNGTRVIFYF